MDKRKAIVIAVVLFLLIGLGTFVFANPTQRGLEGDNTGNTTQGGSESVDDNTDGKEENANEEQDEENDEPVISVIDDGDEDSNNGNGNGGSSNNNGNGNNNSNNDNGSTEEDNSAYLAALAALEKAEQSFLQNDLDYANSLIDALQNNEDKSGLVNRANVVQEVINVETLVKNLQNQVNTAQNIDNVNSARNYRTDEDIINKVNQLADNSKKEELKGILSEVSVILDDTTAPKITGIENGGVYKEATLEIVEENLHTAEIRKENGRWEDFTSGYKASESGTYYVKIIDKAYNRLEISFTIDADAPEGYNVGILNVTHYRENNSYLDYAKVDDEIRVMVYFKEQLATLPTLVLNGVKLENEFFYAEDSSNVANSEYVYMADVKLTQEVIDQIGLTDGIITFTIKGYADALGNVGAELTNANILENANYPSVEFDSVKPVLNFNNGMITSSFTVEVTEDNFDYMIVKPLNGDEIRVTENTYEISGNEDNLRYEITVYDKAGNVSEYRSIYLDNQAPEVEATGYNGNEVPVENGKKYQKVHVKFTDGSLKKVVLLNEDGSEKEVLKTEDDNYYLEKLVYEKTFEEEGTYIVRAIDRNNQKTTITFTIDKTAPKRTSANILEYNVDNNLGTYYVTKGDIIHAYVSFDEPLAENPSFVFINDGKEYVPTKVDQLLPDEKTGKYIYNAYYEVNETDMIDGEVTFKATNIKDTAGNTVEVSEVTNGHRVFVDRSPIQKSHFYFISTHEENRKVIGDGQYLIVEVAFDEEFTSVPRLKIGEGQYIDLDECHWTTDWSANKFVCRNSSVRLDNSLAKLENDKAIPVEISNIVDKAGNETVLTNNDITHTNTYGEIIYDGKAPKYETLRLLRITPEYGTNAKVGDTIRIIVNFDDVTLDTAPSIRLGTDENYVIRTMFYDEKMQSYRVDYEINETELPEGELAIKIYGYKDLAGNTGLTLTNEHINDAVQNKVIIDREVPEVDLSNISSTFEVGVDTYVYPQPGIVTDNIDGNISFGEVHMQWFKKTADGEKGEETTCFGGDNWNTGLTNCDLGTYIVTYRVFDKAGNEAYIEKEITLQDTTNPGFKPSYFEKTVELDRNGVFNDYPIVEGTDNTNGQVTVEKIGEDVDITKVGDYYIRYKVTDASGNSATNKVFVYVRDTKAPELVVDGLTNGFTTSSNVAIHAVDQSNFKIVVKRDGKVVRDQDPGTLNSNNVFGVWFGLTDAYGDGHFEVIATDEYNNSVTIEFDRIMISLADQDVGSNPINADGSFGIFNSFAIKFNRDLTFTNYSLTNGFKIEMEYSVDGGNTYKKSGTVINNSWTGTLGNSTTSKYEGSTFTVTAGSPIYWNGTSVSTRYKEIYDAILATEGTENEVYVRTVFTVIQPTYTKSFALDPVIYSDGGQTVSPQGLAQF